MESFCLRQTQFCLWGSILTGSSRGSGLGWVPHNRPFKHIVLFESEIVKLVRPPAPLDEPGQAAVSELRAKAKPIEPKKPSVARLEPRLARVFGCSCCCSPCKGELPASAQATGLKRSRLSHHSVTQVTCKDTLYVSIQCVYIYI